MRRPSRERSVRAVVEERRDGRGPPEALVQMREQPDVREPLQVNEAPAMRLRDVDDGSPSGVGDRLKRHTVELRMG